MIKILDASGGFPSVVNSLTRVVNIAMAGLITFRAMELRKDSLTDFTGMERTVDPPFINEASLREQGDLARYRLAQYFVLLAWDAVAGIVENDAYSRAAQEGRVKRPEPKLLTVMSKELKLDSEIVQVARSMHRIRNSITHRLGYIDLSRQRADEPLQGSHSVLDGATVESARLAASKLGVDQPLTAGRNIKCIDWSVAEDWHSSRHKRVYFKLEYDNLDEFLGSIVLVATIVARAILRIPSS